MALYGLDVRVVRFGLFAKGRVARLIIIGRIVDIAECLLTIRKRSDSVEPRRLSVGHNRMRLRAVIRNVVCGAAIAGLTLSASPSFAQLSPAQLKAQRDRAARDAAARAQAEQRRAVAAVRAQAQVNLERKKQIIRSASLASAGFKQEEGDGPCSIVAIDNSSNRLDWISASYAPPQGVSYKISFHFERSLGDAFSYLKRPEGEKGIIISLDAQKFRVHDYSILGDDGDEKYNSDYDLELYVDEPFVGIGGFSRYKTISLFVNNINIYNKYIKASSLARSIMGECLRRAVSDAKDWGDKYGKVDGNPNEYYYVDANGNVVRKDR